MELVSTEFTEGRFRYQQVERHGLFAIYRQTHRDGPMVRYEVVRLHIQPEHTWPNGQTTPEKEAYPPPSAWGRQAWTCYTLPEAQVFLARLKAGQEVSV